MTAKTTGEGDKDVHYIDVDISDYHRKPSDRVRFQSVRTMAELQSMQTAWIDNRDRPPTPVSIGVPTSLMTPKMCQNGMHEDYAKNVAVIEYHIARKEYLRALFSIHYLLSGAFLIVENDGSTILKPHHPAVEDIERVQERYRELIRSEIYEKTRQCDEIMELSEDAPKNVYSLLYEGLFADRPILIASDEPDRCLRFLELAFSSIDCGVVLAILEPPYSENIEDYTLLKGMKQYSRSDGFNAVAVFTDFESLRTKEKIWIEHYRGTKLYPFQEFRRSAGAGTKYIFIDKYSTTDPEYHVLNL
ncbi:MAG: hypothetical protein ACFFER_10645 [Candidatus Thorarchaeota archaeon]